MHVHSPIDDSATVIVDGAPQRTLTPDTDFQTEVRQGSHRVEVVTSSGTRTYDLAVHNGFYKALLPATTTQCWVDLDVYDVYYAPTRGDPKVRHRYGASEPIDFGNGYFDEGSLPSSVTEGGTVDMYLQMPCSMMSASDAQIVAALRGH